MITNKSIIIADSNFNGFNYLQPMLMDFWIAKKLPNENSSKDEDNVLWFVKIKNFFQLLKTRFVISTSSLGQ